MNETFQLQENSDHKETRLFLYWIGINVVAWLAWMGFATIPGPFNRSDFLTYVTFFSFGAGMGILQWLLLKQHFSIASYEWVLLTTIGFAVGFYGLIWTALQDNYIVFSPPGTPVLEWDPLLGGALFGLALGCCQSIVWRPRIGRIVVWIVVNVFGWSLGMFLPQYIAYIMRVANTSLLSTIFPVIIAAVVTGIVLVWFIQGQHDLD